MQGPWAGRRHGNNRTDPLVHLVPSCTEKLQTDEQVSKNLFGPPLESAFDHEDFTGDGGTGFGGMGVDRGRVGDLGGQEAGLEGGCGGPLWV